jgi:hypothetical protein
MKLWNNVITNGNKKPTKISYVSSTLFLSTLNKTVLPTENLILFKYGRSSPVDILLFY